MFFVAHTLSALCQNTHFLCSFPLQTAEFAVPGWCLWPLSIKQRVHGCVQGRTTLWGNLCLI